MNTENNIKNDFFVVAANNSQKIRKKSMFINFLKNVFLVEADHIIYDYENGEHCAEWSSKEWYDNLIKADKRIPKEFLDDIYEGIFSNNGYEDYCEVLASVGYDKYGMGHSGYNEVYEFFGFYFLRGSDYNEGPTENFISLYNYLAVDDPDNDVYISNKAKKLIKMG